MEKTMLEVGDILYMPKKFGRGYDGTVKITRVTPKQAEAENGVKFHRTIQDGRVAKVGYTSYGVNFAEIETDEVKAKADLQILMAQNKDAIHYLYQRINYATAEIEYQQKLSDDLTLLINKYKP